MDQAGQTRPDNADLLTICGSRNGVFFLNAAVVDRLREHFGAFLDQEPRLKVMNS